MAEEQSFGIGELSFGIWMLPNYSSSPLANHHNHFSFIHVSLPLHPPFLLESLFILFAAPVWKSRAIIASSDSDDQTIPLSSDELVPDGPANAPRTTKLIDTSLTEFQFESSETRTRTSTTTSKGFIGFSAQVTTKKRTTTVLTNTIPSFEGVANLIIASLPNQTGQLRFRNVGNVPIKEVVCDANEILVSKKQGVDQIALESIKAPFKEKLNQDFGHVLEILLGEPKEVVATTFMILLYTLNEQLVSIEKKEKSRGNQLKKKKEKESSFRIVKEDGEVMETNGPEMKLTEEKARGSEIQDQAEKVGNSKSPFEILKHIYHGDCITFLKLSKLILGEEDWKTSLLDFENVPISNPIIQRIVDLMKIGGEWFHQVDKIDETRLRERRRKVRSKKKKSITQKLSDANVINNEN